MKISDMKIGDSIREMIDEELKKSSKETVDRFNETIKRIEKEQEVIDKMTDEEIENKIFEITSSLVNIASEIDFRKKRIPGTTLLMEGCKLISSVADGMEMLRNLSCGVK